MFVLLARHVIKIQNIRNFITLLAKLHFFKSSYVGRQKVKLSENQSWFDHVLPVLSLHDNNFRLQVGCFKMIKQKTPWNQYLKFLELSENFVLKFHFVFFPKRVDLLYAQQTPEISGWLLTSNISTGSCSVLVEFRLFCILLYLDTPRKVASMYLKWKIIA